MLDSQTVAGLVGAVVLGLLGWIGKSAATVLRERAKRREITTAGEVEITKRREERPWALMEERIDDLEAERERCAAIVARQSELIDRIRTERDAARVEATDWQIEARKAGGALARVAELEDRLLRERADHAAIVERLTADLNRRGGRR